MKNLLNCHVKGLHSFPIKCEDGLYERIFYAGYDHELYDMDAIAVHPHHTDITIEVLEGILTNIIYIETDENDVRREKFKKYKWNSHILNGKGGFEFLGHQFLKVDLDRTKSYVAGDVITMKACELHTVTVEEGMSCIWKITEAKPSCEYLPVNYSLRDLTKWSPEGLYEEVDDEVRNLYIGHLL